jgi:hypothetical protein
MCYYIPKNRVISDNCKNDQCPTSQKCEGSNPNYKREAKLAREAGIVT